MTVVLRENLLNYTEYENLASLPLGTVAQVKEIGFISYYGIERMIILTDKGSFQAGDDLENKVGSITQDCFVKILRTKLNKSRRKFACCDIYEKGDWSVFVDYKNTPIFKDFNGSNCVVDVRTVDVKGQKRKLLMLDGGEIFRMKKCKLEAVIKPGITKSMYIYFGTYYNLRCNFCLDSIAIDNVLLFSFNINCYMSKI